MHARGEARANRVSVIFNSFLVKRYGSLRGHFTLGRIQRDAQRTDVTEIDLSARRDYRCDGNASTEFPVFTELPLLQMNETKGTVRGSKSSVICLARLLRDAFIERIECLRERERKIVEIVEQIVVLSSV